jgi:hypothetical protein
MSALSKDCKLDCLAARGLARYAAVDPSEPGQPFSGSILEQLHWQLQNLFRHPTGRNDCHFKDNLLATCLPLAATPTIWTIGPLGGSTLFDAFYAFRFELLRWGLSAGR